MYGSQHPAVQAVNVRINSHCHSVFVGIKKLLFRNVELVRVRFVDVERGAYESIIQVRDGQYAPTVWREAVRLRLTQNV